MRDRFFKVFLFCLLIPLLGIAQKDSVYTDTVLIVKPPLVIEKKVHISLPTKESIHLDKSLEVGAYYSVLNNMAPSPSFNTTPFHSYGLQATLTLNNFSLGIGIGLLSSTIRYEPIDSFVTVTTTTTSQKKTCYTVDKKNGTREEVCNTVTFTTIEVSNVKIESDNHKTPLSLLQVPFTVGYAFSRGKWRLKPSVQMAYLHRTGPKSNFWQLKESLWMFGPEISLCHSLTDHFSTEIKFEYKTTLSTFSENSEFKRHLNLLGFGVGVSYKF